MSGIVTGRINRFFIESSLDRIIHSWESAMNCSTVVLKVIKDEISCRSNTIEISVLFEDIWLLVKPVVKRLSQQFNISSKLVRYCIYTLFYIKYYYTDNWEKLPTAGCWSAEWKKLLPFVRSWVKLDDKDKLDDEECAVNIF